jgi:hypothetical protein
VLSNLVRRVLTRRLGAASTTDRVETERLRREFSELPEIDQEKPTSIAGADWLNNRRRLRALVAGDDPRRFLQWDVIAKTMFVHNARYVADELSVLRASGCWRTRWRPALREDKSGGPLRSRFYLRSSGNLIHHAYSLSCLETQFGRRIEAFPRIVEFGGGYGSLCRLVHRLGFKGDYLIFDLPEFSALQRYFLGSVGIPIAGRGQRSGIHCVSDLATLEETTHSAAGWLFIGLWSISETPLDFRSEVLLKTANVDRYCVAYQDRFGEVNNHTFFADWTHRQGNLRWTEMEIPHLQGNRYLFGTRESAVAPLE